MYSVTQRIKTIKQPRGGYINPKIFGVDRINDGKLLNESENIHASLIGLAVDYLTRALLGSELTDAFRISIMGAHSADEMENAKYLLLSIKGLDNESIRSACKLVGYDVVFRAGKTFFRGVDIINPDELTIENVRIMVNRSIAFFEKYGPVILDSPTFEGGYTDIVSTGDGDFVTRDTLWDMKVSKNKPTNKHTLQLLMYYLMGKKSIHSDFDLVRNIGIFNPRLNIVYTLNINQISTDIIEKVSKEIIGY
ncbi:hypothetical protein KHQ82_08750 [Mycoplasmatota bacterium]|nr:hypothetical protein KHQ82_08750 [Mycoplasmatota bacterium]